MKEESLKKFFQACQKSFSQNTGKTFPVVVNEAARELRGKIDAADEIILLRTLHDLGLVLPNK